MFSGASSNHLVFAASTGAVSGPNGVPLEGAQYSGSPCQSSSRDSIVRHVACLADWFLRVSLRAHVARVSSRIPASTASGGSLVRPSAYYSLRVGTGYVGRVAFCSHIDTRTAVSWASRPPRLPPRGNAASRRPGLRYVVRPRGLLVCLTTGRSHTARASRAHLAGHSGQSG